MNLEDILISGTRAEKKFLWGFSLEDSNSTIQKKFRLFVIGNYPRYLSSDWADFHYKMIENYIESYRGNCDFLNIGFRGCSKTSLMKLFVVFVLLNDKYSYKRYIRVNTKEIGNSKQIVTDIYNLVVEVEDIYGDVFEKEGKTKREETMGGFTMKNGVKVSAGTVGKTQRGLIQDAFRPDWVIFDDVEDNESIESVVITRKIIAKCDEAIQGMSVDGTYIVLANYISDLGVIEDFRKKAVVEMITPIEDSNGITWGRYTREKVQKLVESAKDWWGDYMCQPQLKAREFNRSWFKYVDMEKVDRFTTRRLLTIDSAVKKGENADFTGFILNFRDTHGNWNVMAWKEKLDSGELIRKMFYLWEKYRLDKIGIEETSFVSAIEPFLKEEQERKRIFMNIEMLSHGGRNKESRIRGLIPMYQQGKIYHITGEAEDLEAELLRFPHLKHDDVIDALAYQIIIKDEQQGGGVVMDDIEDDQEYL